MLNSTIRDILIVPVSYTHLDVYKRKVLRKVAAGTYIGGLEMSDI